MRKEKQIDEIAKLICTYPQCIHYNEIGGCKLSECQTVDIAENLYKQGYRKQEWISVDEMLPESNTAVIVATIDGIVFQCLFGYEGWDLWETNRVHITHWMPLPEPPETKGETE